MSMILGVLAVILVLGGFVGFFFGVIPTLVAWVLAGFCIAAAWRLRPRSQRDRAQRLSGHPTP